MTSKKIIYLDCFSGISGDMVLSACVDAGVPFSFLKKQLSLLGQNANFRITAKKMNKSGIACTKVNVEEIEHHHHGHEAHHAHGSYIEMAKTIKKSRLSPDIKANALKTMRIIAEAEAKVHGKPVNNIHFHELGGVDTIIDACGAAICFKYLNADEIIVSKINAGGSILIKTAHGMLPNPAPATAEILKGYSIYMSSIPFELVTPTGAAILKTYARQEEGELGLKIMKTAFGGGNAEFKAQPNVLRMLICEGKVQEETCVIETNIDDMPPVASGYVMEKLFKAGALDVYFTPVFMKKNRPGQMLSVICTKKTKEKLIDVIFRETTTFGLRFYFTGRETLEREFKTVATKWGKVRIKIGRRKKKIMTASPEFEDCKSIAVMKKIPFLAVYEEAKRKFSFPAKA